MGVSDKRCGVGFLSTLTLGLEDLETLLSVFPSTGLFNPYIYVLSFQQSTSSLRAKIVSFQPCVSKFWPSLNYMEI